MHGITRGQDDDALAQATPSISDLKCIQSGVHIEKKRGGIEEINDKPHGWLDVVQSAVEEMF